MYTAISELENQLDKLLPNGGPLNHNKERYEKMLDATSLWSSAVWGLAQNLEPLSFNQEQINEGLKFSESGIFICGVHRSGTTLLRNLLDHHPTLSVLPSEGTFITNQEQQLLRLPVGERCEYLCKIWLARLVNSNNQAPYWLLGKTANDYSPYVEFTRVFKAWWAVFENKINERNSFWPLMVVQLSYATIQYNKQDKIMPFFWVDKTPTNERYLNRLWKELPKAKIIHVLRNPEDILLSRKRIEKNTAVRIFVRDIMMSFRMALDMSAKNDHRYILIRYEDLCENPKKIMFQIASFLGIENEQVLLNPTVAGIAVEANSSFHKETEAGKILQNNRSNKEDKLNTDEFELLSASVAHLANSFGYSLPTMNRIRSFQIMFINRLW